MNPNSLVPTIDDDGFVLWESHAIVRYLAAKHGAGTLWPADLKQRADSDRWMDWAYTFQAQFRDRVLGPGAHPAGEARPEGDRGGEEECGELLAIPDAALANRPYFAGNSLTIGDIPLGCHVHLWMRLPIERPGAPEPAALVRPPVHARGLQEDRRHPAVVIRVSARAPARAWPARLSPVP